MSDHPPLIPLLDYPSLSERIQVPFDNSERQNCPVLLSTIAKTRQRDSFAAFSRLQYIVVTDSPHESRLQPSTSLAGRGLYPNSAEEGLNRNAIRHIRQGTKPNKRNICITNTPHLGPTGRQLGQAYGYGDSVQHSTTKTWGSLSTSPTSSCQPTYFSDDVARSLSHDGSSPR